MFKLRNTRFKGVFVSNISTLCLLWHEFLPYRYVRTMYINSQKLIVSKMLFKGLCFSNLEQMCEILIIILFALSVDCISQQIAYSSPWQIQQNAPNGKHCCSFLHLALNSHPKLCCIELHLAGFYVALTCPCTIPVSGKLALILEHLAV